MHYFFFDVWFDLILVHIFINCNDKYMYYGKVYLNCMEGGFIWIIYNEFGIFVKMPTVRRLRLQNISEPLRLCTPDMNAEPMKCPSDIWLHCADIIRSPPTIFSDSPISKNLSLEENTQDIKIKADSHLIRLSALILSTHPYIHLPGFLILSTIQNFL